MTFDRDIPPASIQANENLTRTTTDIILRYNEIKPCEFSDEAVEEDRI